MNLQMQITLLLSHCHTSSILHAGHFNSAKNNISQKFVPQSVVSSVIKLFCIFTLFLRVSTFHVISMSMEENQRLKNFTDVEKLVYSGTKLWEDRNEYSSS